MSYTKIDKYVDLVRRTLDPDDYFDLEIQYKKLLKDFKYKPLIYFGGITECYNIDVKDKIICLDLTNQD